MTSRRLAYLAIVLALAARLVAPGTALAGKVPRLMTYQGRIADGRDDRVVVDVNFYKQVGATSPFFIERHADIRVVGGVFSVLIGSKTVGGIAPKTLSGAEEIGIAVNGEELKPRIAFTSVPFAEHAAGSDALVRPDGSRPVALSGTSNRVNIVDPSQDAKIELLATSSSGPGEIVVKDSAETPTVRLNGEDETTGAAAVSVYNGSGAEKVKAEAISGGGKLTITGKEGFFAATLAGSLVSGKGTLKLYGSDGETNTVELDGASPGGVLRLRNASGSSRVLLEADRNGGAYFQLDDASNATFAEFDGLRREFNLRAPNASDPTFRFFTDSGLLTMSSPDGTRTVDLDGDAGSGGSDLRLRNRGGLITLHIDGDDGGAGHGSVITLLDRIGRPVITLDAETVGADRQGGGLITVENSQGRKTARLDGGSYEGSLTLSDRDEKQRILMRASNLSTGSQATFRNGDGDIGVEIFGKSNTTNVGAEVRLHDDTGAVALRLMGADTTGRSRVVTDIVEIVGGADLSEQFDVASRDDVDPKPGTVVSIDAARPGKLKISDRAYDPAVAGIISGAGGVQTGMLMGQRDSVADGRHAVALTGRVYCLVDAGLGAIAPGDLLTTSSTPGHAMKVADPGRAQGAVLGKAMTSLSEGRGLVLVLVSLQ